MKRRTARLLRRFANKLDPYATGGKVVRPVALLKTQAEPQIHISYNGAPVDLSEVVVTALARHRRLNGGLM